MLKKQGMKNIFTKFHLSNHYRARRALRRRMRTGFRYVFDVRSAVRCRGSEQKRQDTRNLAFGEDSLVLPLTSELDALCDGECEPDSATSLTCGALFDVGGASKKETTQQKKMLLRPSRSQKHTRNFLPSAGMLRTGFRYVFDVRSAVRCRRSEQKRQDTKGVLSFLEAPPGIEPGIEVLQTFALPLGHSALFTFFYKN